jgi:hypothetical protein
MARLWAYERGPEGSARNRISVLRGKGSSLSPEEQSELESLIARYPDVPEDPRDHPLWEAMQPIVRIMEANKAEKAAAQARRERPRTLPGP